jgi:hypothetical protein
MNSGAAAGQTIGHAHIHLIPRRQGDVQDPRGGVRGVIPGKGRLLSQPSIIFGGLAFCTACVPEESLFRSSRGSTLGNC